MGPHVGRLEIAEPHGELLRCLGVKDEAEVRCVSATADSYVVAKISGPRGEVVLQLVIGA